MAERNYEQAGLEAVNRLFRPMEEGMDAQRQLQRQAAGIGLQRQLQMDDAATTRQQTLDDAATVRSQQVSDATLAHERGLDRITHQIQKTADTAEDTAKKRRLEKLKDDRDEAVALNYNLDKKGIYSGYSTSQINNASRGELNTILHDLGLESEIVKLNKKPHAELMERLKSIERTDEGRDILMQVFDTADALDWGEAAKESKTTLADVLGEANLKINLQKYGKGPVIEYKNLRVVQHRLMKDTGIYDLMMAPANSTSEDAAKAIGNDTQFKMGLTEAIKDGWMPGDDRPEKANRILDLLQGGKLMEAAQMLDNEGVAGNTPLVEAYAKWASSSALAKQAGIQDRIFRSQNSVQKLREVNQQLNGLVSRHDWLERAVDLTDIKEIMTDLQGMQRGGGMQGRGVTPMEPGDLGYGGTNANAGDTENSDMLSSNDVTNLINPPANATASTPTEANAQTSGLLYDPKDYENLDKDVTAAFSGAGFPETARSAAQSGSISKPTQGWFGRKATELKQAIAPKADLSFIRKSMGPLYDNPEVGPGGIGDVALEMADMAANAWLVGTGFSLLRSAPSTLKKVKDLYSVRGGGAILDLEKLVTTLKKSGTAGAAALESLKAFLKNPKKMKTIKDSMGGMRSYGRYTHPEAGMMGPFPKSTQPPGFLGGFKEYKDRSFYENIPGPMSVPKRRRLNFTPPSSRKPIVTPPPTP